MLTFHTDHISMLYTENKGKYLRIIINDVVCESEATKHVMEDRIMKGIRRLMQLFLHGPGDAKLGGPVDDTHPQSV